MINTKKVLLTIQNSATGPFEANYAIVNERVRLYIPRQANAGSSIHKAFTKELESAMEGQLFDCQLVEVGDEYDEYSSRVAMLGQDKASYEDNRYIKGVFTLSNDILRFFNSVWDIESPMGNNGQQVITFATKEERHQLIDLSDAISLGIERGYKQSYSKIRYEAHSSVAFLLHFKQAAPREEILQLMEAITDYYSLFCKKFIRVETIRLRVTPEHQVGYFGDPAGNGNERHHFANRLIEQRDIDQYSDQPLIDWVAQYEKCKICIGLMKDAEKVSDEQLRFICYSRALEVFHKELFINDDKAPVTYFDDLFDFVSVNKLSKVERKDFGSSKITLAHRLYDLARYAYPILSDGDFRLVFGHIILEGRIQQLADTRNYLIHFSDSKREKAWKPDQVPHVNFSLFMMLKVLLLKKFGFTDKAITRAVGTFYRDHFGM